MVIKTFASRAEDPGQDSHLRHGDFFVSNHTIDLELALQWQPRQALGVTGSAVGLAGPVSVYCDWVR